MSYYDKVIVRPKPADEPAVNRVIEPTTTPTPGALPGATRACPHVATITFGAGSSHPFGDLLRSKRDRLHTVRNRHRRSSLSESQDRRSRRCDVDRRDHAAGSPRPPLAAPQRRPRRPRIRFRHRTTISVQFGVDKQLQRQNDQGSDGTTTSGRPINLNETTFDDVYGRIGMQKIGAGYRRHRRQKHSRNFVWSDSSAQTDATNVGTVGTNPQIPLDVNFTSYKSWGIEGGNQLYFARTRFTPYVGYLVGPEQTPGYSRHVRWCANEVAPGLAAQDGKFFEKSSAFSLGPTARHGRGGGAVRGHG